MSVLFGIIGEQPVRISYSTENKDTESLEYGRENADGWGVGFYHDKVAYVVKRTAAFYSDVRLNTVMEKVRSKAVITHFRNATIGEVKENNTHPFRYGAWIFGHSGTIAHFRKVKALIIKSLPQLFLDKIGGNTDSEYCFYLFISYLKGKGYIKKGDISFEKVVDALRLTADTLGNWQNEINPKDISTYNFIVSNGRYLLANRKGKPLYYLKQKWSGNDNSFSVSNVKISIDEDMGNYVIISSEKMGDSHRWNLIGDNHIVGVDDKLNIIQQPL